MVTRRVLASLVVLASTASVACSAAPRVEAHAPTTTADKVADLCAGVPESEWARPSFFEPGQIESVRPLLGEARVVKFAKSELRGAEIAIRTTPRESKHRVGRELRCHFAWHEAAGLASREAIEDPLFVGQPDVSFDQRAGQLLIRIAGRDRAEGEEILRRAQILAAPAASAARD
jgi:hypothetical protein